jgi:acyl transferase domain-containing protein
MYQGMQAHCMTACRLPGEIVSPSKLWDLLVQERSARSDIPNNRFIVDAWYYTNKSRLSSINTQGGFFLSKDNSFC